MDNTLHMYARNRKPYVLPHKDVNQSTACSPSLILGHSEQLCYSTLGFVAWDLDREMPAGIRQRLQVIVIRTLCLEPSKVLKHMLPLKHVKSP